MKSLTKYVSVSGLEFSIKLLTIRGRVELGLQQFFKIAASDNAPTYKDFRTKKIKMLAPLSLN